MKIIITGSLGNISKPLTDELVKQGHTVTVISSKPEKKAAIHAFGATAAIGTIEDVAFLTNTFTSADAVYCMLPPFNYFDPDLDMMGTTRRQVGNYCKAIQASGVKNVVHFSSIGTHTDIGNGLLAFAQGVVDMNAFMHNGLVNEDYYRHRPKVMGNVKMADFANEFAVAIGQ
ncbi:SDR family oxidoreductase [Spirosoma pollinicola]|uniref:NAD(P)-binding domain-containing protein n=1 Tax=Spirosoma pollinicola TaxID=2057025 RepID=A0A2K8Z7H6_9BACT|nr:NAD(P)H-binding protein [Spirosoma pollinicola]AUD05823.1 hypothetical protein CWM47_30640 [Spirosoma pollinicola]